MSDIDFGPSEFLKTARFYVHDRNRELDFINDIHATAHNLWANLEGNTAETDVSWFARLLFDADKFAPDGSRWENAPEVVRRHWLATSRRTLENLPRLMSRVAHRCKHMADAAKMAIEADRAVRKGDGG